MRAWQQAGSCTALFGSCNGSYMAARRAADCWQGTSIVSPPPAGATRAVVLEVGGMKCGGCSAAVKRILLQQPSVAGAAVNLLTETAVVQVGRGRVEGGCCAGSCVRSALPPLVVPVVLLPHPAQNKIEAIRPSAACAWWCCGAGAGAAGRRRGEQRAAQQGCGAGRRRGADRQGVPGAAAHRRHWGAGHGRLAEREEGGGAEAQVRAGAVDAVGAAALCRVGACHKVGSIISA